MSENIQQNDSPKLELKKMLDEAVANAVEVKTTELKKELEVKSKEIEDLKSKVEKNIFENKSQPMETKASIRKFISDEDADQLVNAINTKTPTISMNLKSFDIAKKSNTAYSTDNNPMGGYLVMPERKPLVDITPFPNSELLFDYIGAESISGNQAQIPLFNYQYNAGADNVNKVTEGQQVQLNDATVNLEMRLVNILGLTKTIKQTLTTSIINREWANLVMAQLDKDVKRQIIRNIFGSSSSSKAIENLSLQLATLNPNHIVTTEVAGDLKFSDIIEKTFNIDTLRLTEFNKMIIGIPKKVFGKLTVAYNQFQYYNQQFFKDGMISFGGLNIPFFLIDDERIKPSVDNTGAYNSGETLLYLLDASAYRMYNNPAMTMLNQNYIFDQQATGYTTYIYTGYFAGSLVDHYKAAIIKAK